MQEGLCQANTAIRDKPTSEKKTSDNDQKIQDRTLNLQKEVRNLRAKALRAPGQRLQAVDAAVVKVTNEFKERSNIWRIKRPNGQIENWVRDLGCRLITVRHLPATQTPGAISDILLAIKASTGGYDGVGDGDVDNPGKSETFSDRSARRFPLEGRVMGQMMIAQEFKTAPG